jgi:hypothetical protein
MKNFSVFKLFLVLIMLAGLGLFLSAIYDLEFGDSSNSSESTPLSYEQEQANKEKAMVGTYVCPNEQAPFQIEKVVLNADKTAVVYSAGSVSYKGSWEDDSSIDLGIQVSTVDYGMFYIRGNMIYDSGSAAKAKDESHGRHIQKQ